MGPMTTQQDLDAKLSAGGVRPAGTPDQVIKWRLECLMCGVGNDKADVQAMVRHAQRTHKLTDAKLSGGTIETVPFGLKHQRHIWILANGMPWLHAVPGE